MLHRVRRTFHKCGTVCAWIVLLILSQTGRNKIEVLFWHTPGSFFHTTYHSYLSLCHTNEADNQFNIVTEFQLRFWVCYSQVLCIRQFHFGRVHWLFQTARKGWIGKPFYQNSFIFPVIQLIVSTVTIFNQSAYQLKIHLLAWIWNFVSYATDL